MYPKFINGACTHFLPTLNPKSNHLNVPSKHLNCINALFTVFYYQLIMVSIHCVHLTRSMQSQLVRPYVSLSCGVCLSGRSIELHCVRVCVHNRTYTYAVLSTKMASDFQMHAFFSLLLILVHDYMYNLLYSFARSICVCVCARQGLHHFHLCVKTLKDMPSKHSCNQCDT